MSLDLLSWLESMPVFPKFYWKGNVEIAACGALASWDHLPEVEEGKRVYGGRAFTEAPFKDDIWENFPKSYFFLPAYERIQDANGVIHSNSPCIPWSKREDLPLYPEWEKLIHAALKNPSFSKVVLARRTTLNFETPPSPFSILRSLREKSTAKVIFGFQPSEGMTFLGATPERLYARKNRTIQCDVVAGTSKNKQDLCDPKLQLEFSYVKEWIHSTLSPLCTSATYAHEDSYVTGYKIVHIYNCLEGILKPSVTDVELIKALHPTPAIGGFPQAAAVEFIHQNEPFERGWYSAPIGFASKEEAEFAVGIRSALIQNSDMHLFAGLGVVEGSDPLLEWQELELKIAQFL